MNRARQALQALKSSVSSRARIRILSTAVCLAVIILLSLIIMGTVGVNGKIKFENSERGCLLYMKFDDEYYIDSYNDGYCVFPIIGAAITSILALAFLAYWAMVMRRREESVPRYISIALMAVSGVMALFSFAICGEIGIGLKGRHLCDMATSISALYDAQVSAGLMGGCWLAVLILEWFQFKSRFPNSVGHIGKKPRI